ncbi:MAG TPA: 30S ribosomal protein S20 [Candidatus Paceibacterota bacterium]|nr:30S ribosomal protein S20 [Candidatus Paceibacterota bacterium]
MPITKSAKKALRVSDRKRVFNLRRKKSIENAVFELKKLLKAKKVEDALKLLPKVYKAIDKAAKANTLSKNTAARKKSRLTALVRKSK